MAIYLDEVHMGHDTDLIGFPHLLLCMGLVYMINNDMYGVHLTNIEHTKNAIDMFDGWLKRMNVDRNNARALYGSANLKVRYGDNGSQTEWKNEMTQIAGKLGYSGTVYGFDTSIISPKDGTYVQYESDNNQRCKIFYKRNEKMNYGDMSHSEQVVKISGTKIRTDKFVTMASSAGVKPTRSNKGQLHEVNYATRLMHFDV
jgi:hypothetical protein